MTSTARDTKTSGSGRAAEPGSGKRPLPYFKWEGTMAELPSTLRKLVGTRAYQNLKSAYGWVKHERRNRPSMPLKRKLQVWRRGFFAESATMYDFDRNNPAEYLSDFTRAARWRDINAHNEFFAHKLVLRSFLLAMGFRQAETLALLFEGKIVGSPFSPDAQHITPDELIRQLLSRGGSYIIKPEDGASGKDVLLLENRGGELIIRRGPEVTPFTVANLVALSAAGDPPHMTLIEERLEQDVFWRALFHESGNTLRVLTLWTPGEPAPFIARAVQRIGTSMTVPTDNWSAGGISAPVDLATGRLGPGRMRPARTAGLVATEGLPHHPENGAQISGAVLPGWDRIQDTVLRAAASLPFNRMAGWDVLVTSGGEPVIIEGNGNSDIDLFQVHGGLLADPRIRRFHEALG